MSVLPAPDEKPAYVQRMFGTIAARYDRVNRLMTFGLDQGWRRFAAREVAAAVPAGSGVMVLDVGTGTGDFLPILHRELGTRFAVGVDFSLPMMQAGAANVTGSSAYVGGDALRLPFSMIRSTP